MERSASTYSVDAIEFAAHLAHEANRAYAASIGEDPKPAWEDATEETRQSARNGVVFHWDNPKITPVESHNNWLKFKEAGGWHYGPVIDHERLTHPQFVPYKDLPEEQKRKDYIFKAVVLAAVNFMGRSPVS